MEGLARRSLDHAASSGVMRDKIGSRQEVIVGTGSLVAGDFDLSQQENPVPRLGTPEPLCSRRWRRRGSVRPPPARFPSPCSDSISNDAGRLKLLPGVPRTLPGDRSRGSRLPHVRIGDLAVLALDLAYLAEELEGDSLHALGT